jgi:hypothetical protein
VARLRWNQVNLETKEIIFHVSKTTAVLPLPMAPALCWTILRVCHPLTIASAFVFPKAAELAKRTGTLSNQFYKVMEQAGIAPAAQERRDR